MMMDFGVPYDKKGTRLPRWRQALWRARITPSAPRTMTMAYSPTCIVTNLPVCGISQAGMATSQMSERATMKPTSCRADPDAFRRHHTTELTHGYGSDPDRCGIEARQISEGLGMTPFSCAGGIEGSNDHPRRQSWFPRG